MDIGELVGWSQAQDLVRGSPRCCLLASMRITSLGGCITGLGSVILLGGYGSQDPLGMGPNMGTTQGYVHISIT